MTDDGGTCVSHETLSAVERENVVIWIMYGSRLCGFLFVCHFDKFCDLGLTFHFNAQSASKDRNQSQLIVGQAAPTHHCFNLTYSFAGGSLEKFYRFQV